MQRAAILASGRAVALETKGTVRDARGLTSSTKISPSLTANCTFMSPTTSRPRASRRVCSRSRAWISSPRLCGGREQAESPECTPACSMCSMSPPMITSRPSLTASTSTSMASLRKRSSSTGDSLDTSIAASM